MRESWGEHEGYDSKNGWLDVQMWIYTVVFDRQKKAPMEGARYG